MEHAPELARLETASALGVERKCHTNEVSPVIMRAALNAVPGWYESKGLNVK